ncbi:nitroreductase family protein [Micromonospora echinofusca]|uniref:Nitroreductase family protein n=1 Tax=Micromonospora echinofusca TaxID=47858 RepID=A0ABS3VKW4_MICEH|nr:nitroreductase family protein [Micromonospora echinofusca]MBO4205083.1 nitroreductase family protein [Micromonospora echinofusca]
MEFREVVRRRRMVRNYDPDRPVPAEVVQRLLDHAVRAPSAGFAQGWGFLVLESAEDRERFWAAASPGGSGRQRWLEGMRRAPLIVVPHANRATYLERYAEPDKGWADRSPDRWPVPYWYVDTGFAALLMLLTAVDEGLGACFFGIPPQRTGAYREAFGVPEDFLPIGALTIGYRAPDQRSPSLRRGRRPVDQVVHRGRWGG